MTRREERTDRPAERGGQDMDRVQTEMIEQLDNISHVIRDIGGWRPGTHQLAAKIAANDGELLCQRRRHRLPTRRRHRNAVEQQQRRPRTIDGVIDHVNLRIITIDP